MSYLKAVLIYTLTYGESPENLIKHYSDISAASRNLIAAIANAMPHGRDYQTVGNDAYKMDREIHEDMLRQIDKINQYAQESALHIHKQL